MRRPLRARSSTQPVSVPFSIPAPVGGWNARDALAAMPIEDAEIMLNFFPYTTYVGPRPGSLNYGSNVGGDIGTMMQWAGGSSIKLLVSTSTLLINVSVASAGTATNSTVANGFSTAAWEYLNFGAGGGNFLVMVNGLDQPQQWAGGASASAMNLNMLTGTATNLTNVCEFQQRLFFTYKGSLSFYYVHAANAIGGTCQAFDLSGLFALGGELSAIGTWTHDGGDGLDDLVAFVTNKGQVAVYQGTDPASANTWAMVGVYRMPAPLGRRFLQKMGGDLAMLTEQGVLKLSSVLSGVAPTPYLTDKIQNHVNTAVRFYRNNFGWQLKYYPNGNWLVINVPNPLGAEQFVMNTITGAWCRFQGMNAKCWEVYDNDIYFAQMGQIVQGDTGTNDNGLDIQVDVKQAASTFGMPGRIKKFHTFKPLIASNGGLPLAFIINTDFSNRSPTSFPTPLPAIFPEWDVALWDDYFWADAPQIIVSWQSAQGIGTYGQLRAKGAVNTETIQWFGTNLIIEPGGL